jgi:hypothetical protein
MRSLAGRPSHKGVTRQAAELQAQWQIMVNGVGLLRSVTE